MATIREYFDLDVKTFSIAGEWEIRTQQGDVFAKLIPKVAYDFEANAKFWYIFVPASEDLSGCLSPIFRLPELRDCQLTPNGDGVQILNGFADYSERQSTDTLQFTKRIHLYIDLEIDQINRASMVTQALELGFFLSIRDREYARKRSEMEKPMAFVSHDSRDKDSFVRDLVHELSKNFCPVWYDEFTLKIGDSLRDSIEKGLRETRKCIIVLSPNFLSNGGWGKAEYDSIFTREILEKSNVILPVWLNVGVEDVYQYSPRLADKVGVPASLGATEVARRLAQVIRHEV